MSSSCEAYKTILVGLFGIANVTHAKEEIEQTRLVVTNFVSGVAAEKAGIMINGVLIKYDGKVVTNHNALNEYKNQLESDSVEIAVLREGKEIKFKITKGSIGVYLTELLPDLKYKDDAIVIEGIPKLEWNTGKINSFLACVELVANYLGIKKDYVEINGISGAAFRLHFCKDWCPSSLDPTCGYNSGDGT